MIDFKDKINPLQLFVEKRQFFNQNNQWLTGCSYGGELAQLGGLACLGVMVFISRSHRIFYLSSVKKFVMSLDSLVEYFLQ